MNGWKIILGQLTPLSDEGLSWQINYCEVKISVGTLFFCYPDYNNYPWNGICNIADWDWTMLPQQDDGTYYVVKKKEHPLKTI